MMNKIKMLVNKINNSEIIVGIKKYFDEHNEIEIANKFSLSTLIIIVSYISFTLR